MRDGSSALRIADSPPLEVNLEHETLNDPDFIITLEPHELPQHIDGAGDVHGP